jgi:carboxyl-terminal processing protease
MSKRIGISVAAGVAIILLIGGGFGFGLLVGRRMPQTIVVQGVSGIDATSTTADFGAFWQAWQTINENYLKAKDISNENKVRGAITGLVNSLGDPYSEYFSPKDAKSFKDDVNGSFSGIGAEIGTQKGQLVVIAPLKNTPAEKAGLKPNDKILLIDTTSTEGMPIDQAISFIRGPENSTVKLTIVRDGWDKPKEFPIVRQSIEAPTLDFKMLPGNIAYVQLYQFNANASRLFWDAMKQASGSDTQGLILGSSREPRRLLGCRGGLGRVVSSPRHRGRKRGGEEQCRFGYLARKRQ